MNVDSGLVDQIVARVLASLEADRTGAINGADRTDSTDQPHALRLSEPVITASILQERAGDAREIEVLPRAVLTPSARDWLQSRGVRCRRAREFPGRSRAGADTSGSWLLVVVDDTLAVERTVSEWSSQAGGTVIVDRCSNTERAVTRATTALLEKRAGNVLVFADEAEKAACLANRNENVRAAAIADPARVDAVVRSLRPNLWIFAPSGRSYFELRAACRKLMFGGR
ncbi:MAG: hypothetical protein GXP27_03030 [Planctomycetes bacterium]|nr:hypothetical protein [Planctomycetota bacterium]